MLKNKSDSDRDKRRTFPHSQHHRTERSDTPSRTLKFRVQNLHFEMSCKEMLNSKVNKEINTLEVSSQSLCGHKNNLASRKRKHEDPDEGKNQNADFDHHENSDGKKAKKTHKNTNSTVYPWMLAYRKKIQGILSSYLHS